jgi:hypothetical protein
LWVPALLMRESQTGAAWACSWQKCPGINNLHLNYDK